MARNDKCGSVGLNVRLSALYPSAIVRQKWNDVLAVLNSAHNGGYTFTSYRWYVDGTPIDGATGSYLYLDASRLDPNSVYRAELTRPDGVRLQTCDIIPTTHSDLTSYPTIPTPVSAGQSVYVNTPSPCTVHIYNMAGQLISMHTLSPYDTFPSPHHPGIYILTITVDDIRLSHKLVVR